MKNLYELYEDRAWEMEVYLIKIHLGWFVTQDIYK